MSEYAACPEWIGVRWQELWAYDAIRNVDYIDTLHIVLDQEILCKKSKEFEVFNFENNLA